jgi:hypothetical protein
MLPIPTGRLIYAPCQMAFTFYDLATKKSLINRTSLLRIKSFACLYYIVTQLSTVVEQNIRVLLNQHSAEEINSIFSIGAEKQITI